MKLDNESVNFKPDVIVVLGGGINSSGIIPDFVKPRIGSALEQSGGKIPLIMSGKWSFLISFKPPSSEAQAMKKYALKQNPKFDPKLIYCEEESMDTIGNAYYTKVNYILPKGLYNVLLVTSEFHMPRSIYIFNKVLGSKFTITAYPTKSNFDKSDFKVKARTEKKLLRFTEAILIFVPSGHHEAVKKVLNRFPGYNDRPEFSRAFLHGLIRNETKKLDAYGIKDSH